MLGLLGPYRFSPEVSLIDVCKYFLNDSMKSHYFRFFYFVLHLSLLVFSTAVSSATFASDKGAVEKLFKNYWSVFSAVKYEQAVDFIYPPDLELMRKEYVPIFERALQSDSQQVRQIGQKFSDGVPEGAFADISAREVFVRTSRFFIQGSPEALQVLKQSKVMIKQVRFVTASQANILYTVQFGRDSFGDDQESFIKTDGKWYLRLKDVQKNAKALNDALFPSK